MRFKKTVKRLLESLLGVTVYSARPHGRDDCRDMRNSAISINTILDVGANDGGSALKFLEAFPDAVIHSFEPVGSTFESLEKNVRAHPRVHCHRLALGSSPGSATIYLTQHSSMSSLLRPEVVRGEEVVPVTTVDAFAAENGLDRIDLLKIDAEGFDLEVLKGAEGMLGQGRVRFVLAEVGFHPGNRDHVLFDDVREFLIAKGFSVFGFYDQQLEWSGEKRLRYANACFVREPN